MSISHLKPNARFSWDVKAAVEDCVSTATSCIGIFAATLGQEKGEERDEERAGGERTVEGPALRVRQSPRGYCPMKLADGKSGNVRFGRRKSSHKK